MFFEKTREETQMLASERSRTYLVDGLIATNSLNIITGASTVGKTTLLYFLTKCISDNDKWLGFDVDEGKVIIFDNEMGLLDFNEKMNSFNQSNLKNIIYIEDQFIDIKNNTEKNAFYSYIENKVNNDNLKLVVIDSLSACCGNLDENSNSDMRMFMEFADTLSHICTVFVIHHRGKNNLNEFRGASIIKDRADNFFVMEKQGELKITKNRNGLYQNTVIPFTLNEDDGYHYIELNKADYLPFQHKKTISTYIRENLEDGMNQSELFKKLSDKNIRFTTKNAVDALKTMKDIECRKGNKNASFYYFKK